MIDIDGVILATQKLVDLIPKTSNWYLPEHGTYEWRIGDKLTHLPTPTGVRPIAEIVNEVETLRSLAGHLRNYGARIPFSYKTIDTIADNMLPVELYRAYREQGQD